MAAEDALVVTQQLAGEALGTRVETLEDPSGAWTLEQVSAPPLTNRFVRSQGEGLTRGLTKSAYWLRFKVDNRLAESQPWMLEVAYPPLDDIRLFVPRSEGGYDLRVTGDQHPFAQRDVLYRTFLFELQESPGVHTYYLRAQTTGSVTLPLHVWSGTGFLQHLMSELPPLWIFYGLLLVMAAYNFVVFISVRELAYLYYVFYIASYASFQFALSGLSFQYLWPDAIWWNSKALTLSIGASFALGLLFQREFLGSKQRFPGMDRYCQVVIGVSAVLAVASLFADYAMSIRVLVVWGVNVIVFGLYAALRTAIRGSRSAVYYLIAWLFLLLGVLLYLLQTLGVVPETFVGRWGMQLGAAIEVTMLSLGLADRINVMRADLQRLNGQLSLNITQLSEALVQAQAATRAKGEFLASVSHELRTPLNAIINIPEGILQEFQQVPAITCNGCHAIFALEAGEQPDYDQPCPECAVTGGLRAHEGWTYEGNPEVTARHLRHVHSASKHLLEVVSSILDSSKLEAGRMELNVTEVDLAELLDDALAPLSELAAKKNVVLVLPAVRRGARIRADRVRVAQILLNLAGNAIKFSDKGGSVRVSMEAEEDAYVVRVKDEGIGIAPADRERIFESFSQVDASNTRQFGGTGLGLAISKKLVELHGGSIWVDSELGQGSTFSVRLPTGGPTQGPEERVRSPESRASARVASWASPPEGGQP